MIRVLFSFLLFSFFLQMNAQDIDLYIKNKNDNYKLPEINTQMTVEEFELLSQNMRMKDMLYATIVPGYIHFKAKENTVGYWLVAIRSASYLTMSGLYLSGQNKLFSIDTGNLSDEELSDAKRHQYTFYTALGVATATYLYDVIQGDWLLQKKQKKIRYKYAIIASKHPVSYSDKSLYPSLALTIQF